MIQQLFADGFSLKRSKSFPNRRRVNPTGTIVVAKTIAIQIGAIIPPRNIPNLNHNLFGILSVFGEKMASIRNKIDILKANNFGELPSINGKNPITMKIKAKKIPKLLSELI